MMDVTDLRHDGGWSDRDGVIYKPASLTDAEREAVAWACAALSVNAFILTDDAQTSERHAATLRGLLERLK